MFRKYNENISYLFSNIFLYGNSLIEIALKLVANGLINDNPALVQVMVSVLYRLSINITNSLV